MATREGKFLLTAEDRTARAFDSVDRRLAGLTRSFVQLGSSLSAPVAGLLAATKVAIAHADAIGDQAKQAGLTTAAYQELSYAAKQLDVDQQSLDAALVKFRDRLGEARLGAKDAQKDFRLLGLDPNQFRSTDEAFAAVTLHLSQLQDEFSRSTIQANLFGRGAGPQLTGYLTTSAAEVARLRQEAHSLGSVLSKETIDKADESSKKLDALANVTKTQLSTALVDIAPIVIAAGEAAAMSARGWGLLSVEIIKVADELNKYLENRTEVKQLVENNRKAAQPLLDTYNELDAAIRRMDASAEASAKTRAEILRKRLKEVAEQLSAYGIGIGATTTRGVFDQAPAPTAAPKPPRPPVDPEEARRQAEKDLERQEDFLGRMEEYDRENDERIAASRKKERDQIEDTLAKYSDEGAAMAKLREDRALLDKALQQNTISAERHAEAIKNIEKAEAELVEKKGMSVFAEQAARNIQDITASMIQAAMAGRHLGDVIVDSLRRIAAEMAAQAALEGLFGLLAGSGVPFLASVGQAGLKGIGGRAAGGPVAANDPYVVGEKGPELFVPRTAGHIVPNHKLAANGPAQQQIVNITYNTNASGGTQAAQVMALQRVFQENNRMLKADLAEAKLRKF